MKKAVSVPDDVLRAAELHARRVGKTRSEVFADAMTEYLARHTAGGNGGGSGNGQSAARKGGKRKRQGVKARFSSEQLRQFMKKKPAPKSWFDEAGADLTKPRDD
jgi:hypothetical protein